MDRNKYTKENLTDAASKVKTFTEMMIHFNISSGSARTNLIKRCKEFEVDTSHFLKHNIAQYAGVKKKSPEEIFKTKKKVHAHRLRRALIEVGVEHNCSKCNILPIWNGGKLVLQVDHIDGNNKNNKRKNLRFLCPNCHSQTETWGFKTFIMAH